MAQYATLNYYRLGLSNGVLFRLKKIAKERGELLSDIIREAINEHFGITPTTVIARGRRPRGEKTWKEIKAEREARKAEREAKKAKQAKEETK